jgi:hypothetical protein
MEQKYSVPREEILRRLDFVSLNQPTKFCADCRGAASNSIVLLCSGEFSSCGLGWTHPKNIKNKNEKANFGTICLLKVITALRDGQWCSTLPFCVPHLFILFKRMC